MDETRNIDRVRQACFVILPIVAQAHRDASGTRRANRAAVCTGHARRTNCYGKSDSTNPYPHTLALSHLYPPAPHRPR